MDVHLCIYIYVLTYLNKIRRVERYMFCSFICIRMYILYMWIYMYIWMYIYVFIYIHTHFYMYKYEDAYTNI
jgi:hypothetical protein